METQTATFDRWTVYGTPHYYPTNDLAKKFLHLKIGFTEYRNKTKIRALTKDQLKLVEYLGYKVEITNRGWYGGVKD